MSDNSRPKGFRLGACGWLVGGAAWLWACGHSAQADDDRAVDEEPAAGQAAEQAAEQVRKFDLGRHFDQHLQQLFPNPGSLGQAQAERAGDGPPAAATVAALLAIGDARLELIDAACSLSPDQRRRLRLAIECEVRGLAAEVEAARARYQGAILEFDHRSQAGQERMQEFHQEMQRLAMRRRFLLDGDSLLAKALPATLDGDQLARLTAETDRRRGRRWQVIVANFLEGVDDGLGLDQGQYDEIERLLLEQLPALRLDAAAVGNSLHHAEQLVALMKLADVDAGRLRRAVSERQWKTLAPWREQGAQVRPQIESLGVLEKVPE